MVFNKDGFTEELERLQASLSQAEEWVTKAENNESNENKRHFNQMNKILEQVSKRLESLYKHIEAHKKTWDEETLKKRKGDYDNIVTRYKSIQQGVEWIRSERSKFSM
jgi:predicted amidophosphoribosyltransferase